MRLKSAGVLAAGAALIAGCAPGDGSNAAQNAVANSDQELPASTSSVDGQAPENVTDDAQENEASAGSTEACARVDASEARAFAGLELTGTSGDYRFYARPRELLCSEPGADGAGECEVPGSAQIRVEGPDGTYGFRASGEAPALLIYSPDGVTCRPRN